MIRRILICMAAISAVALLGGCDDEATKQKAQEQTQPQPEWKVEVSVGGKKIEETQVAAKKVRLETTMGDIVIELDQAKAPLAVANFTRYVEEGFYNDTIFHRVIPNFMIQAGGLTKQLQQKPTYEPIRNEASNGLKNKRGTVAMGQKPGDPDSATSHFYINLLDNVHLDYTPPRSPGYTVFGKVVEGMDVVDKIGAVKTGLQDVPVTPVVINAATLVSDE